MPSQATTKGHIPEERHRVLDTYHGGGDWRAVARHNGFHRTTAENLVSHGRVENLPRWGVRATKMTPEISTALVMCLHERCTYTLRALKALIREDFNVELSETTIPATLSTSYTPLSRYRKQFTRYNGDTNKQKRKEFTEKPIGHNDQGDLVVYFDETNFNLYTKRLPWQGEELTARNPPTVAASKCKTNAGFLVALCETIKDSGVYKNEHVDKYIVIVFDNAPAHNQTEVLVPDYDDLVLLRLGHYSPMCNPIENCFGFLKAYIKQYLALMRDESSTDHLRRSTYFKD
ncbi:hypothetical protein PC110_g6055 [Phytophthora cactorum]|uniref:Tc1-like transposase DDE domain-containing protein n=1 Tax=Phytophthora cactorum TaxID=29920 RepID=A0A329SNT4_9STRA|nr:hypothetical protein PC110_g6055 [Phytophthora cactorum]